MPKKCIMYEGGVNYQIKGTTDGYFESCGEENFGDLSYLGSIEE